MARIRTIKPDFWTDGNMVSLSPFARLLYIGMWNFTLCDHGHVADDAMKLKLQILPMDNIDINDLLNEIMEQGRVVRVADNEGRTYLLIRRFNDHQKIDPRWKTRCPACAHRDSLNPVETQVSFSEPHRDSPKLPLGREGMGRDGIGEEGNNTCSPATPSSERPTRFEEFWEHYPRKVGKDKAKTKYVAATKRADEQTIIDGATRLASDPNLPEKKYIPHPTTWLERGSWDDEPLPARWDTPKSEQRLQQGLELVQRATSRQPAQPTWELPAFDHQEIEQ